MKLNLNVMIDLIAVIILVLIFMNSCVEKEHSNHRKLFRGLMAVNAVILLVDMGAWIVDGKNLPGIRVLQLMLNSLIFIMQALYGWLWLIYAEYWVMHGTVLRKQRMILYGLPVLAEAIMLTANIWTGWLFRVNTENYYERSEFFVLGSLVYFFYMSIATAISLRGYIRESKPEWKRRCQYLALVIVFPFFAAVMQIFFYGVSLVNPFIALTILMMEFNVQRQQLVERKQRLTIQEKELVESRSVLILSQIRPHFLYNSLVGIKQLCETDPQMAAEALEHFAYYLRGNLESLSSSNLISFEKEVTHVKDYLHLEQMRFPDKLQIVWELEFQEYVLPALTLQPVVENAVRHGICKKKGMGTIRIRSEWRDNMVILTVTDNGVGFDINAPQKGEHMHIGIENVRIRLKVLCEATLFIQSEEGVGTRVQINLPWEGRIE